jgi:hypothetical protein
MGTNLDPNAVPNPDPAAAAAPPEGPPASNPWEPLQARGFDPSGYDPDAIVNGANLYKALTSRDYQEGAVQQVLRHAGFPEDLSVQELRQMVQEAREAQNDPYAAFYGDPNDPYGNPAPAPFDPRQMQEIVSQQVSQQLQQFQQQQAEVERQRQYETEFQREVERVSGAKQFEDSEQIWLAAEAQRLRQSMPYATTAQIVDKAGEEIQGRLMRRLQAMSQQVVAEQPAPGLPQGGMIPAQQQPTMSTDEAMQAWIRLSNGG